MPEIVVRAAAGREIKAHGIYLEQHGGREVVDSFLAAVNDTFGALATMPRMGPLCGFRRAATRRLRRWPVKGFENWTIFYQPKRNGIEVFTSSTARAISRVCWMDSCIFRGRLSPGGRRRCMMSK